MIVLRWCLITGAIPLLLSCSHGHVETGSEQSAHPSGPDSATASASWIDSADFFADSLSIGRKGLNRIEMAQYRTEASVYVILKLFSMQNGTSALRQKVVFAKDGISGLHVELADFNNDGFKDVTCVSATAGRGANEIRRLWIYAGEGDSLVYIKNSMDYPNIRYNERRDCIDAFRVYGGCSTDFLRITGDSLQEFATVELSEGLTVTTIDRHGKRRVIKRDTSEHESFVRYKNFAPLERDDGY